MYSILLKINVHNFRLVYNTHILMNAECNLLDSSFKPHYNFRIYRLL